MKFADTQIYEASSIEVDQNFILKERCRKTAVVGRRLKLMGKTTESCIRR